MPELHDQPDFVKKIAELEKEGEKQGLPYINPDQVRRLIAPQYPEVEFVGKGTHQVVIGHPRKPDRVIAFGFRGTETFISPFEAGETYHTHRIMSTLFPEHFPHFYAVKEGKEPSSARQRVIINSNEKVNEERAAKIKAEIQAKAASLGILVALDGAVANYVIDEKGNRIYIDAVINNPYAFQRADVNKILKYLRKTRGAEDSMGLGQKDAKNKARERQVLSSLRRLREISLLKQAFHVIVTAGVNPLEENWFDSMIENFRVTDKAKPAKEDRASRQRIRRLTSKMYQYYQENPQINPAKLKLEPS